MPLDIGKVKSKTALVQVEYAGEIINVSYFPNRITPEYQQTVKELTNAPSDSYTEKDGWALMLSVVERWDLQDDGKEIPVTPDAVNIVPLSVLGAIYRKVMEQTRPNPTSGETSAAGSLQGAE